MSLLLTVEKTTGLLKVTCDAAGVTVKVAAVGRISGVTPRAGDVIDGLDGVDQSVTGLSIQVPASQPFIGG